MCKISHVSDVVRRAVGSLTMISQASRGSIENIMFGNTPERWTRFSKPKRFLCNHVCTRCRHNNRACSILCNPIQVLLSKLIWHNILTGR